MHVLGTPPAFILSQDQTLRSILVCRFPVRGNRRVSISSKIKVNSKKYQINVLCGMYQSVFRGACLACPRFVTVSGSQGAEGPVPDARASLRRKKELYQHPACRVKENFQEIFPTRCGRWYGGDDHKHNHHSLLSVPPSVFFARRQTAMQRQETPLEKKPY